MCCFCCAFCSGLPMCLATRTVCIAVLLLRLLATDPIMRLIQLTSALTLMTTARVQAQGNVQSPDYAPATPTAAPAQTPTAPAGNVFETPKPTAQGKSHWWLRAEVYAPVEALQVKKTKKPTPKKTTTKTKTTTSRSTGNSTNAAYPMTVNPWRVAGAALGAALVVDAMQN